MVLLCSIRPLTDLMFICNFSLVFLLDYSRILKICCYQQFNIFLLNFQIFISEIINLELHIHLSVYYRNYNLSQIHDSFWDYQNQHVIELIKYYENTEKYLLFLSTMVSSAHVCSSLKRVYEFEH